MVIYQVMSCFITPRLTKYTNQYNSFLSASNIDSTNDSWIKELVLNKILLYIKDTELADPGTVFMVGELEAMYVEMLDGHGIVWSTHVFDLQSFYLQGVPGLLTRLPDLIFDSAVQNNTQNKMARNFFNHW